MEQNKLNKNKKVPSMPAVFGGFVYQLYQTECSENYQDEKIAKNEVWKNSIFEINVK